MDDHELAVGVHGKIYYLVFCQKWEESERGWGTRPDGYSLHCTIQDVGNYIREYWNSMPDEVLDEYSRPDGNPYPCFLDRETYEKVKRSKNGIRFYKTAPPPTPLGIKDEDIGGWIPWKGGGYGRK